MTFVPFGFQVLGIIPSHIMSQLYICVFDINMSQCVSCVFFCDICTFGVGVQGKVPATAGSILWSQRTSLHLRCGYFLMIYNLLTEKFKQICIFLTVKTPILIDIYCQLNENNGILKFLRFTKRTEGRASK